MFIYEMTPEGDFLGSNPASITISRTIDVFLSAKISCTQPFGSKRSGIFDNHGKKREDPGNDVATMHPMLHPDILRSLTLHRASTSQSR